MNKSQHHGSLRQALIDAALEILDVEGGEAVTIRAVARAAKVSHAAPANHFRDRCALLTGVAIKCFEALRACALSARSAAPPAPAARIEAFADGYVAYALAHPNRYRLMWRMDLLAQANPALVELVNGLYGDVEADVAALPNRPPSSATTLVIALCSAVHGYASMRIDGNFVAAVDEASGKPRHQAIIGMLLRGEPA